MTDNRKSLSIQLVLFFGAIICMSAAMGVHESIFNNYLADTFNLSAPARGWLEMPRELPGFLVVVMAGVLWALPVTRLGLVGAAIFLVGTVGLAVLGSSYGAMVVMMVLASAGQHLIHPVSASIALATSDATNRGWRMGQMRATETIGLILGAGIVWFLFDKVHPQYRLGFLIAGVVGLLAGIFYGFMHIPQLHKPRPKLVLRRRFTLYYVLEFVFGARKQIFLTFGPWVLIQVYGLSASSIAGLLMTAAIIGIVFKPLAGLAIDRLGERAVMVVDGLALAVVCLGYGYALHLVLLTRSVAPGYFLADGLFSSAAFGSTVGTTARTLACGCFIADNLLFALGSARATYLSRMSHCHQEISSTLAMGVSINHIASMTIPVVAGALWAALGYEHLFAAAAVLALSISALSTLVPARGVPLIAHQPPAPEPPLEPELQPVAAESSSLAK